MRTIKNLDKYITYMITEYREKCERSAFENNFEARRTLWKIAVFVIERASDPEEYLDELRDASIGTVSASRIESTIRSARRRVNSHA